VPGRTGERVDGPTCAEAIGLFDAGVGWRQVGVSLKVTPAIARYLWEEWKTPLGAPGPPPPWRMPAAFDSGLETDRDERELTEWERQMWQHQAEQEAECREDQEARARRRAHRRSRGARRAGASSTRESERKVECQIPAVSYAVSAPRQPVQDCG
jgi:hypothetical protein